MALDEISESPDDALWLTRGPVSMFGRDGSDSRGFRRNRSLFCFLRLLPRAVGRGVATMKHVSQQIGVMTTRGVLALLLDAWKNGEPRGLKTGLRAQCFFRFSAWFGLCNVLYVFYGLSVP